MFSTTSDAVCPLLFWFAAFLLGLLASRLTFAIADHMKRNKVKKEYKRDLWKD